MRYQLFCGESRDDTWYLGTFESYSAAEIFMTQHRANIESKLLRAYMRYRIKPHPDDTGLCIEQQVTK